MWKPGGRIPPLVLLLLDWGANGNLTSDGTNGYAYSSENLLTGAGGVTLRYDPLMRLAEVVDGSTVRFAYDGVDRIADYDANGVLVRRYVHGPGMDEPLVWYVGSDVVYRRWLHADERGSIVAASVNAGTALATRAYDEYGNSTGQGDVGPFRYTGQTWVPEAGLYYYKARMYDPELGRFVQTDPIGYADGMNLYAYVGGDPVNFVDPWGWEGGPITVTQCRNADEEWDEDKKRCVSQFTPSHLPNLGGETGLDLSATPPDCNTPGL